MGLESVEIMMVVEDEFQIQLSGETFYSELLVLGELHKHLVVRLKERGDMIDDTQIWERLKAIVIGHLGTPESLVTPTMHLVDDLGADG